MRMSIQLANEAGPEILTLTSTLVLSALPFGFWICFIYWRLACQSKDPIDLRLVLLHTRIYIYCAILYWYRL